MTKKKHILESNIDENVFALGIVTSNSEFQMTMLLNQHCNLNLQMSMPIEKVFSSNILRFPSSFENQDETLKIQLIKNSHLGYILINSIKDIDYFLIVSGEFNQSFILLLQEGVRKCDNIELVNVMNQVQIKKILPFRQTY